MSSFFFFPDHRSWLGPLREVISVSSFGRKIMDESVVPSCHPQEGFELDSSLGQEAGSNGMDFPHLRLDGPVADDINKVLVSL